MKHQAYSQFFTDSGAFALHNEPIVNRAYTCLLFLFVPVFCLYLFLSISFFCLYLRTIDARYPQVFFTSKKLNGSKPTRVSLIPPAPALLIMDDCNADSKKTPAGFCWRFYRATNNTQELLFHNNRPEHRAILAIEPNCLGLIFRQAFHHLVVIRN